MALLGFLMAMSSPGHAEAANLAEEIVWYTNQVRTAYGLVPLQVNPALNKAALWQARTMASHNQMAHVLDGMGPGERLRAVGYPFSTYAENVAYNLGYENPAAFTAMFKRSLGLSPRHYLKQNELSKRSLF